MRHLTILYDPGCNLCRQCRDWLAAQPQLVPLRFLPQGTERADRHSPELRVGPGEPVDDLIAVSDTGAIYRGARAWVMCFWALRKYRPLAVRLAHPTLLPLARRAYELVSRHRQWLSLWFTPRQRDLTDAALAEQIERRTAAGAPCGDHCVSVLHERGLGLGGRS